MNLRKIAIHTFFPIEVCNAVIDITALVAALLGDWGGRRHLNFLPR
jgi:hypothetical protein